MRRLLTTLVALLFVAPLAMAQQDDVGWELSFERATGGTWLVRNSTIWTQDDAGILEGADLLARDGLIVAVGVGLDAPDDATIIDGSGMHVTPGIIDAHSHTAGGSNEASENITAEVRITDRLDPNDPDIYRQLAGGTTAAQILHGSANAIGGQSAIVKWRYRVPQAEQLLIEGATPRIKFALGENPKRSAFSLPIPGAPRRYPATRMGVANSIRRAFLAARDYQNEQEAYDALSPEATEHAVPPRRDLRLDALVEILNGARKVTAHSYRQDEIIMLIRVAEEMGFTIGDFTHVLEGYKASHEIAAHGAGASTFSDWWGYKIEAFDAIPYNGAIMHDDGIVVSFNSDSGELARHLNLEAAKAIKYGGLEEQNALAFVTSNAAKQLLLFEQMGSLSVGKDADFVLWNGHPLSIYSRPEATFVDGRKVFDRALDRRMLQAREAEKARIVALIEGDSEADAGEDSEADPDDEGESGEAHRFADPLPRAYASSPHTQRAATALVGATVHTVAGDVIDNGVVVFADGVITAVGGPGTPIPAGAERVDVVGKSLFPGMISADSTVGLVEISGGAAGSVDSAEIDDINSDLRAEVAVNAASEHIAVTRANGVTHTLTIPRGGILAGASALLRLDGWSWEEMTALSRAGMHLILPGGGGGFFFGPRPSEDDLELQREEALERVDATLEAARAYDRARSAAQAGRSADVDVKLEGLVPVIRGHMPVFIHTAGAHAIKAALAWAAEQDLRIVLLDTGDTWRAADEIAAANVPVIVSAVFQIPGNEDDPYDAMYANAARLRDAGVHFAIGDGPAGPSSDDRNLPYQAGHAAAYGLSPEEALRAVTLSPAEILGLGDSLGSIEVGKSATLVLADGDLLEVRTNVLRGWIDGNEVDLSSKHTRLWEQWRDRPRVGDQ